LPGIHAKRTYIELDGVDISKYCNNFPLTDSKDEVEVTGFTDDSKQYVDGFRDIGATLSGNWGDADGSMIEEQFNELNESGDVVPLVYGPAGNAAGNVMLQYDCKVMSFDRTSAIGSAVTFSAKLRLSNPQPGAFS
jgi:hypothetical protein